MSATAKTSFASDNSTGAHPDILRAIVDANDGSVMGYGADRYTEEAERLFARELGDRARPFFVYAGTAANVIALQAISQSGDVIMCSTCSHVYASECGAPERLTGSKLAGLPEEHGKITPAQIEAEFERRTGPHAGNPAAVSITQATEKCTVYTVDEVRAIADMCHAHGMKLHMDGARLANAVVSLNSTLAEVTVDAGVDVVSFGGTKNGLLCGEAVVCFDQATAKRLGYVRMQSLHLASKMRFLSVQFSELLRDGLWRRNAENANQMTARLVSGLRELAGVELLHPVQANIVLLTMPSAAAATLHNEFEFYDRSQHEQTTSLRLVCSFRTTTEEVDAFLAAASEQLGSNAA